MNFGLTGFLGDAYPGVKAAHVTFVIFWMAGRVLQPRFYVYHHASAPGSGCQAANAAVDTIGRGSSARASISIS